MTVFLRRIASKDEATQGRGYPFTLPLFSAPLSVELRKPVTMLTGENGAGKSTLLEMLAHHCGFGLSGGNRNHHHAKADPAIERLASSMTFSWMPKVTTGFFFRAETFNDFASHLDGMAQEVGDIAYDGYGGTSLHQKSHGEAFLAFFENRVLGGRGLFILDEPEAALSPLRQMAILSMVHQAAASGRAQFIIATHSPLLLKYPDADILEVRRGEIALTPYEKTENYRIYHRLFNDERFFRQFLDE